ncbi:MvdC/MvdD family ATP grasp protein [Massilia sp. YMA4]|uniref:MvdC/MvdD family ATP grasp protein n=1 Tax=Massilia sp. YMA4 TaxID=1593482 RepID=UPI000DD1359E|nr:hypothetical protein [Massilia sp. YMA4]AXA93635.1 hypothetical protein DPH57_22295 [Massilia sp. YMA4]
MILIVTGKDDLHALMVQRELHARGQPCALFETDLIAHSPAISWRFDSGRARVSLRCREGDPVDLADVGAIWWRRPQPKQQLNAATPGEHGALIDVECRGTMMGMFSAGFDGAWVSSPAATVRAADKFLQLAVASRHGFHVPRTVVTQRRQDVLELYRAVNGRVIVKPVVGVSEPLLFTRFLDDPAGIDEASFAACPAVYQEYIPGCRHIRLNCFGERSWAAAIDTDALDWRADLSVPVSAWDVPAALHAQVRQVLDALDLKMGVVDLKQDPNGEFVWLEVNPQGQFLFLEPLTGMPMTRHFADFLVAASAARH